MVTDEIEVQVRQAEIHGKGSGECISPRPVIASPVQCKAEEALKAAEEVLACREELPRCLSIMCQQLMSAMHVIMVDVCHAFALFCVVLFDQIASLGRSLQGTSTEQPTCHH